MERCFNPARISLLSLTIAFLSQGIVPAQAAVQSPTVERAVSLLFSSPNDVLDSNCAWVGQSLGVVETVEFSEAAGYRAASPLILDDWMQTTGSLSGGQQRVAGIFDRSVSRPPTSIAQVRSDGATLFLLVALGAPLIALTRFVINSCRRRRSPSWDMPLDMDAFAAPPLAPARSRDSHRVRCRVIHTRLGTA